ncbi:hypothetical protein TGRH88_018150 [Toxoplasma gondii]|uniref:Uncharacterized protein n=1 Tax=Toxoplasma gondii TaxID=5811 RepID=A0A7J6KE97_TOXGO|nr:hypothetical protein TGRH88_018150 [Toxoplasma gondii]
MRTEATSCLPWKEFIKTACRYNGGRFVPAQSMLKSTHARYGFWEDRLPYGKTHVGTHTPGDGQAFKLCRACVFCHPGGLAAMRGNKDWRHCSVGIRHRSGEIHWHQVASQSHVVASLYYRTNGRIGRIRLPGWQACVNVFFGC